MRQYIVNLTNNLIGKNRYDAIFERLSHPRKFLNHVMDDLRKHDVKRMSPAKLGELMCSFEKDDIGDPARDIVFSGSGEDMQRDLVSFCLAFVIRDRLDGRRSSKTPAWRKHGS